MSDNLKKNWFVVLVAIIFIGGIGYFIIDQYNSVFKGKNVDGKSVVASISEQNIFADEYYEQMFENVGDAYLVSLFEKTVLSNIETTEEIKEEAKASATNTYDYYASQGQQALDQLDEILRQLGYEGSHQLQNYYEDQAKRIVLLRTYLMDHTNEAQAYVDANKGGLYSHILVSSSTPSTPTDEEKQKQQDVEDAIASGKDLSEIAKEFSGDTGSAANGGYIGYIDINNTTYVPEFVQGATSLTTEGETTDWVQSSYGFHKIWLKSKNIDDIIADDDFINSFAANDTKIINQLIWDKAEELGVSFQNDDIMNQIRTGLGLQEAE